MSSAMLINGSSTRSSYWQCIVGSWTKSGPIGACSSPKTLFLGRDSIPHDRSLAQLKSNDTKMAEVTVGLCLHCKHSRVVESDRGSKFYLCQLSLTDPRFPKY